MLTIKKVFYKEAKYKGCRYFLHPFECYLICNFYGIDNYKIIFKPVDFDGLKIFN